MGDEAEDARGFIAACTSTAPKLVLVGHYTLGAAGHAVVLSPTGARLAASHGLGYRAKAVDLLVDRTSPPLATTWCC